MNNPAYRTQSRTGRRRNPRILIVEDESLLGWSMANALQRAGYESEVVGCGDEALGKLRAGRYDLAISDVRLPGMDGLDLAGRVKRISGEIPVVLLITSEDHDDPRLQSTPFVDHILEKPFKLNDLVETVHGCIERSGQDFA